jgi:hypothetical protein
VYRRRKRRRRGRRGREGKVKQGRNIKEVGGSVPSAD